MSLKAPEIDILSLWEDGGALPLPICSDKLHSLVAVLLLLRLFFIICSFIDWPLQCEELELIDLFESTFCVLYLQTIAKATMKSSSAVELESISVFKCLCSKLVLISEYGR